MGPVKRVSTARASQGMRFGAFLFGMGLAGAAVVAVRYRSEMRAVRARLATLDSRVIERRCGPTEFACSGDGYPLLVVHGALGGFDQGLWIAQRIGPDPDALALQVIALSRFGHLRSPVPAGATLDTQADAYAALLDALSIPQAAVLAVSGGTTSAIPLRRASPGAGLRARSPLPGLPARDGRAAPVRLRRAAPQ